MQISSRKPEARAARSGTFANSGAGSGSLVTRSSPLRDTPEHCADGRVCLLSVASFLSLEEFRVPLGDDFDGVVDHSDRGLVVNRVSGKRWRRPPVAPLFDRRSPVSPSVGATR